MDDRLVADHQFDVCTFAVKGSDLETFSVCLDFARGTLAILRKGWLTLEFQEGTTLEQAKAVERILNEHVAGVAYHYFPEES